MTIRERTLLALRTPIKQDFLGSLEDSADSRPSIERIIDGLLRKAAKGEVAAARELREYMALKDET